jgi:hypothetical protein
MQTAKLIHWLDVDKFIGYFVDYPDYWTQDESLDNLNDHLVNLQHDLTSGDIPGIRRVGELHGP